MATLQSLTTAQLRKLASIKEQIESLEAELDAIAGGEPSAPAKVPGASKMSAEGRARIAAAQRARWAKVRAANGAVADEEAAPGKRRKVSAAAKARMAAAAKARWAKVKAQGKKRL
jgi:hypothetical protein